MESFCSERISTWLKTEEYLRGYDSAVEFQVRAHARSQLGKTGQERERT